MNLSRLRRPAAAVAGMTLALFVAQALLMQRTLLQKHAAKFYEMGQRSEAQFREKSSLYRKLGAVAGAFFILLFL